MTEPSPYQPYWDMLVGKQANLPAHQVPIGVFEKGQQDGTHIGIAIWMHPRFGKVARIGRSDELRILNDPAAEEDFSFGIFAWCRAITQTAYDHWLATGEWLPGSLPERKKPGRAKAKPAEAAAPTAAQS